VIRRTTLLLLLGVLVAAGLVPASATERPVGATRVFAKVQPPGFPAYVHVHSNGRVYAGTYTNPSGDTMRSRVFEYTSGGTLLRSWTVPGQDLTKPRGVQVAATDARGRLVLLEKSRARVLTLDLRTGRFRVQATIPDLPGGGRPIPNYAAWGPGGALFVTDYGQAVVWRIPAAGGTPQPWLRSPKLEGVAGFGTTGIVFEPATRSFLVSQQTSGDPLDLFRGHLYRVKVRPDGRPGALSTVWTAGGPLDLPDGFGIARSGNIYLALLGANKLVKLSPAGRVLARWSATGSAVPFDSPSNATFLGTRVLVANQSAILGDASHHVILDVEVGERGAPVVVPRASVLR
jgi:sugar lactone lactonase YvrE